MESTSIFTGEHALIAYAMMVISFALRSAPKPPNIGALWIMSIVQFAFMNLTESASNVKAAGGGPPPQTPPKD